MAKRSSPSETVLTFRLRCLAMMLIALKMIGSTSTVERFFTGINGEALCDEAHKGNPPPAVLSNRGDEIATVDHRKLYMADEPAPLFLSRGKRHHVPVFCRDFYSDTFEKILSFSPDFFGTIRAHMRVEFPFDYCDPTYGHRPAFYPDYFLPTPYV